MLSMVFFVELCVTFIYLYRRDTQMNSGVLQSSFGKPSLKGRAKKSFYLYTFYLIVLYLDYALKSQVSNAIPSL